MLDSMLQVGSVWGQSAKPGEARWVARSSPAAAVHSCSLGVASGSVKKYKVISRGLLPADDSVDRLGCAAHGRAPPPHTFPTEEQRRRRPQRALRPSHPAPATPAPDSFTNSTPQPAPCCVAGTKGHSTSCPPHRSHARASGEQRIHCTARPSAHALSKSPLAPPHTGFSMCGAPSDTHTHLHTPTPVRLCKNSGWFARHHPTQPSTRTPPRLRHSAL